MKNQCDDYSYFSLNALSYLTTLLFGIAFGLSISIKLIHLIVSLVVIGIVFRGFTIYVWSRGKNQLPSRNQDSLFSQSYLLQAPSILPTGSSGCFSITGKGRGMKRFLIGFCLVLLVGYLLVASLHFPTFYMVLLKIFSWEAYKIK